MPCALILHTLRVFGPFMVKSSPHGLFGTAWSRFVCLYLIFFGRFAFLHFLLFVVGCRKEYVVGLDSGVYSIVVVLLVLVSVLKNV